MRGSLSAQANLLLGTTVNIWKPPPLESLLAKKTREILKDLGYPTAKDYVTTVRDGAYFTVGFICPVGTSGRWSRTAKCPDALSMLIRPWLRRQKN
jgi:hypothetical protein